jgi:hypothetical protein
MVAAELNLQPIENRGQVARLTGLLALSFS